MRERVDRDPVVGARGGAAEELPGSLGFLREGSLEGRDREPARLALRLAQEAVRDGEELRRRSPARGSLERLPDRDLKRGADAVRRPDARRDERLARPVLGVRELPERGRELRGELGWVGQRVRQGRAQLLGTRLACGDGRGRVIGRGPRRPRRRPFRLGGRAAHHAEPAGTRTPAGVRRMP